MSLQEYLQSIIDVSDRLHLTGSLKLPPLQPVQSIIIHHTLGHPTIGGILATYSQTKDPAQFFIDRSGKIYQTLPVGSTGNQILPSPMGLSKRQHYRCRD